jgi:hypothetical protein
MKTSHTKLKSSFFLTLALVVTPLWAKPVAEVINVQGQVFLVTPEGKTKSLKKTDHIEENSEVMVGEDGGITLNDYYDATYHLTEGTHLKFFDKTVQLKKGKTWIQSLNSRHPLGLGTANGQVDYWKGEFIATFDQATSKSQFLVVNGEVEVSNNLDKNMKYTVTAGTFTLIDPANENGLPRTPTKVGLNSLNSALAEFKVLPQKLMETPAAKREIASVPEAAASVKKGEIIFMTNGKADREPASAAGGAHKYFKKKLAKKKNDSMSAPIRFYGMKAAAPVAEVAPRKPASVRPLNVVALPKKVAADLNMDAEFTDSLRIEKDSQPKHSKELENLIQDLKSY